MSLLGIDVGTTGCKSASFSEDGDLIAIAYREYCSLSLPNGYAELDSKKVLSDVWACISEAAGKTEHDPIKALSVSSLGEAMTPVSKDRSIIGNSILCSDVRGEKYIEKLSTQISQEEFYKINPNILGTNYSLPKLLWIKENQPEIYNHAYKFMLWADLIIYLLGGLPLTSNSLANRTLLFDIYQQDWSNKLLQLTGTEREKLPDIAASGTFAGIINADIAEKLNLPKDVKLIVGGHDQCCNALGAGVFEQGKTVCGMGTFECITPVYQKIPQEINLLLKNGLNIENHVLPNRYVSFLYNQSGSLIKWFRDTFAAADKKLIGEDIDIYDFLISEIPAEPTDLLVLPHFEMTGPPKFITDSCGVILGLKTSTTRGEILRSMMECVTFYFIESLEQLEKIGIETSEFIATGGGAKSDSWLQIKADILGVPFTRLRQTECSLVGAAIIAGLAVNIWKSAKEAADNLIHQEVRFDPNKKMHSRYKQKYGLYKELYPNLKNYLLKTKF